MKVVALCVSVFAAALLSFGLTIAHANQKSDLPAPPPSPAPVVCVVPGLVTDAHIFVSSSVLMVNAESDAECELLTEGR